MPVPPDFREEVQKAESCKDIGYLQMLSAEVGGFSWAADGLRLIGYAQERLGDWTGARATWSAVCKYDKTELEPNTALKTGKAFSKVHLAGHQEKSKEFAPRVILFTGHRIDAPGRKKPRFPPEMEDRARTMIIKALLEVKEKTIGELMGISGGASGGDILFHEVCREFNVPSRMYLAIPEDEYIKASVADGGPLWEERFKDLREKIQTKILSRSGDLPRWLQGKKGYGIWQRANLWMLHSAMAISNDKITLIALWNGEEGDGPGGTKDMVRRARDRGANFVHLDARQLIE